jgi:hypothetical protein
VIKMLVSTNGGDSFSPMTPAATGVTTASAFLPSTDGWPHLPGGAFRLVTVPTACVFGTRVTVAWEDFREGVGRIYYAQSPDGGSSWSTGVSGSPLLTDPILSNFHHFLPQIIADPAGVLGCSFYEFGPKPTSLLIDVMMAESYDGGATFHYFTVTEQPWDPVVDAPWSHGDSRVTFIGDYFGIDASGTGFYPLWTDTRTGIQELWTAIVPERRCTFIIERSTLGQDEIDARRGQPGGPVVPDAFRVVVDGFSGPQLGVTGPGATGGRHEHHLHRRHAGYGRVRPGSAAVHGPLQHRLRRDRHSVQFPGRHQDRDPTRDGAHRFGGCGNRAHQATEPIHPARRPGLAQH